MFFNVVCGKGKKGDIFEYLALIHLCQIKIKKIKNKPKSQCYLLVNKEREKTRKSPLEKMGSFFLGVDFTVFPDSEFFAFIIILLDFLAKFKSS